MIEPVTGVMPSMPETSDSGTQDLVVRIWGMAAGKAFFQNVYGRDLRENSALLSGVEHPIQPEDVIGVQCGTRKARFRVLQAHDAGLPQRIQARVELLEGQECPWKDQLTATQSKSSVAVRADRSNKRQFPRHKLRFPIELRDNRGGSAPMQTNASDISGRGCYVETLVPLPLGTNLTLVFWIDSDKITTSGLVRASDPGVGMGIEFVGLNTPDRERLQAYLGKMASAAKGIG
jgi:hypothetical protein